MGDRGPAVRGGWWVTGGPAVRGGGWVTEGRLSVEEGGCGGPGAGCPWRRVGDRGPAVRGGGWVTGGRLSMEEGG